MAINIRRSPSNLTKPGGTTIKSITPAPVITNISKNPDNSYSRGFTGGMGYGQALNNSEAAFLLGQQAVAAQRAKLGRVGLLSPLSVANQVYTPSVAKISTPKLGINKQPLKQVKNLSLAIQGFYK